MAAAAAANEGKAAVERNLASFQATAEQKFKEKMAQFAQMMKDRDEKMQVGVWVGAALGGRLTGRASRC